jgi:hypothetical protein
VGPFLEIYRLGGPQEKKRNDSKLDLTRERGPTWSKTYSDAPKRINSPGGSLHEIDLCLKVSRGLNILGDAISLFRIDFGKD